MRALLDNRHPGALYVLFPYLGYTAAACAEKFEKHFLGISAPSLISPIRGSTLEADVVSPGGYPFAKIPQISQEEFELSARQFAGLDSLRKLLTESPNVPDLYLDPEFRAEMDRRLRLRLGSGLKENPDPWGNPAVTRPMFEN